MRPRQSVDAGPAQNPVAPLRSADWRFLVPAPPAGRFRHVAIVGGDAGVAEQLAGLDIAQTVSGELPRASGADAVVALRATSLPLEVIAAAVAADGVLYVEIARRQRGWRASSPTVVRRTLERAGLSVLAVYAIDADLRTTRALIPLDVPAALAWYGRAGFGITTTKEWASDRLRRMASATLGRWAARFLGSYVVVAMGRHRAPTAAGVLATDEVASALGVSATSASNLVPLLFSYGRDRVVVLPFARDGREPLAVVKVPRSASFNERTENEHVRARELRAHIEPRLARAIPEPRVLARAGRVAVSIEGCLPGRSLASTRGRWKISQRRRIADLRLATDWLIDFHRQTEVRREAWSARLHSELIEPKLRAYESAFAITDDESRLFAAARRRSELLSGFHIPLVWAHRDYGVWNLAREGNELAVLDWEGAQEGLPVCDMLQLSTSWLFVARYVPHPGAEMLAVRALFLAEERSDRWARAAATALSRYMTALVIDARFMPLLLTFHRVELALRLLEQQDNTAVPVVALLARHARRLFDERPLAS